MITAEAAERAGLVSSVVPHAQLMDAALEIAQDICSHSRPIVILAKEAVNASYETTLKEGVHMERRLFHSTFALKDQKEGMEAFIQKRKPQFVHH